MKKILIPIATGFEEIEAITLIDVLRRANLEVITASVEDKTQVQGANGITIIPDTNIKNIKIFAPIGKYKYEPISASNPERYFMVIEAIKIAAKAIRLLAMSSLCCIVNWVLYVAIVNIVSSIQMYGYYGIPLS